MKSAHRSPPAQTPVLLYDGLCGMCNGAVRFVLKRDERRGLRFAPLQGEFAAGVLAEHPEAGGIDSILYVEPSGQGGTRVLSRSDALLAVARQLGGVWRVAALAQIVPRGIRDRLYDAVARNRRRISPALPACPLPPAADAHRFLP